MTEISINDLTENNLPEVAQIHIAAFPKSALGKLGTRAVERYYWWQLRGPHDAIALGIFKERMLAGYCFAGLFRGSLSGFLHKNRLFLIWRITTHPWLLATPIFRERLNFGWSIIRHRNIKSIPQPVIPAKSFGILAIAIKPECQGIGLGNALMLETEKMARERGFDHLHLTVTMNNTRSIGFYEKLGWQKAMAADNVWRGTMIKELVDLHE